MTVRQLGPLNQRERDILDVLVQMHGELGLDKTFTSTAVAHIVGGPCPGSLAGLAMKGYVLQRTGAGGVAYCVTESGFALFAGIEGQI